MIKSKSPLMLKSGAASESARELADRIGAALAAQARGPIRLRLSVYAGRGRRIHASRTEHFAAQELLDQAGTVFAVGNDAPRGGALGDFIELSRAEARRFLKKVAQGA